MTAASFADGIANVVTEADSVLSARISWDTPSAVAWPFSWRLILPNLCVPWLCWSQPCSFEQAAQSYRESLRRSADGTGPRRRVSYWKSFSVPVGPRTVAPRSSAPHHPTRPVVLDGASRALHARFDETWRLLLDWLPDDAVYPARRDAFPPAGEPAGIISARDCFR